jgi:hypothetical protein
MFALKPGKDGNIFDCPKPPKPTRQVILKLCPRDPYLRDTSCRPNTSISGQLIKTKYTDPCCKEKEGFIIETFDGDCLVPINLECFCLNETGDDRELVTVIYEDVSDHYCSKLGKPVRLLKALRMWTGLIRTAVGVVRRAPKLDSNGMPYHQIVDVREEVQIELIPVHTMGVADDFAFMCELEGETVDITYVDFGKEDPSHQCGIPITVIDLEVVVEEQVEV